MHGTLRHFFSTVGFCLCGMLLFSCGRWNGDTAEPMKPDYPFNNREPERTDTISDYVFPNPYGWLEKLENQKVLNWAKKQNQTTFDYISRLPDRKKIQKQLETLQISKEYRKVVKEGPFYFYSVAEQNPEREIIYRYDTRTGKETILCDPVAFSANPNARLAGLSLSPDYRILCFSLQDPVTGNEKIFLKNTETGNFYRDMISCSFNSSLAWDNRGGFFYNRELKTASAKGKIIHAVFYHTVGTDPLLDEPVFFNASRPRDIHQVTLTSDYRYVILKSITPQGKVSIRFADIQAPPPHPFRLLIDNTDITTQVVDHWKDNQFLAITAEGSPNGKAVIINPEKPKPEFWKPFIKEKEDRLLRIYPAGGRFFVKSSLHTFHKLSVYDSSGTALYQVELPGAGLVDGLNSRPDYDELVYSFQSLNCPTTLYRYSIKQNKSEVFKKPATTILPENYIVKKEFCLTREGIGIPLIIMHRSDRIPDVESPLIVFFSGGMNESYLPNFSAERLPFVDAGGIFVLACLRGNEELGKGWRNEGKGMLREQTQNDLKMCLEYLTEEKYTSPGNIALVTKHAGAMPAIETALNSPGLIRFIAVTQGIFDLTGFSRYQDCQACVENETGNIKTDTDYRNWAERMSPLTKAYNGTQLPAIYMEHKIVDRIVSPVHSFKFIAALQDIKSDNNPKLIRIDNEPGSQNKKQELFIQADRLALAMYLLKMNVK
jgi:prolyl oligopeptidase